MKAIGSLERWAARIVIRGTTFTRPQSFLDYRAMLLEMPDSVSPKSDFDSIGV